MFQHENYHKFGTGGRGYKNIHTFLRYRNFHVGAFFTFTLYLGPVFQCTLDRRSNWSPINFGSWSEIISMTVFQSPI